MNVDEIKQVVKLTIDELTQRKLIKVNYPTILKIVNDKLYGFFNNTSDNENIALILRKLSNDPYIDIIFGQYRDEQTLEEIAEDFDVDVSTIKRNKKRLIYAIYEELEK